MFGSPLSFPWNQNHQTLPVYHTCHIVSLRVGKKHFFVNSETFGIHNWQKKRASYDNFGITSNWINQISNLNALFFLLLTMATWYYHTIYLVFTYFASFTDNEYDIFKDVSNLHVQGSRLNGKIYKFDKKSFFLIELHGVHGVCFFQVWCPYPFVWGIRPSGKNLGTLPSQVKIS